MIFQFKSYYAAVKKDDNIAVFVLVIKGTNLFEIPRLDTDAFKKDMERIILEHGFNVEDFDIRYISQEEYDNRAGAGNEEDIKTFFDEL